MNNGDKAIIFDVDGVLLDLWKTQADFIRETFDFEYDPSVFPKRVPRFEQTPSDLRAFRDAFVHSEIYEKIPPKDGMVALLKDLKKAGYTLLILTAVSLEEEVTSKRRKNLEDVFGPIFTDYFYTGGNVLKGEFLKQLAKQYSYTAFIEDHPGQVASSVGVVTDSIWMETEQFQFNKNLLDFSKVKVVHNADEIRKIFLS